MNRNLIPEWVMPDKILLVWPEELYKREQKTEKILQFYIGLIKTLAINEIKVEIISVLKNQFSSISSRFSESKNVKVIYKTELSKISDIWIRDFGPLFLNNENSILPVRFRYNPSYNKTKREKDWAELNDSAGYLLTSQVPMNIELDGNDLILDGGNFIHNGLGTAIVTDRIISDNESLFESEIKEILEKKLGIRELIIVPAEPGDDTGHIDGLVRFLNENTLAVSEYPDEYFYKESYISVEEYSESKRVTENIARFLMEKGFKVLRIPNSIPLKGKYNFENATGNYLNFLSVGNKIFLPQYNDRISNERAVNAFKKGNEEYRLEKKIIPVMADATPLAEYGGVINCITLQIYGGK